MWYYNIKEREVNKMKCKICNKKTNCNSSIGKDSFIVCNKCIETLNIKYNLDPYSIYTIIMAIGIEKER